MDDPVPEAEGGDVVEVFEEGAGQQQQPAHHHVRPGVNLAIGKGPDQEVAAQDDVEDAGHEQLDELGRVNDLATQPLAEHLLGNLIVAEAHLVHLAEFVRLVEAVDEDLAGVAADVGDADHGQDGPVAAVVHGVRQ